MYSENLPAVGTSPRRAYIHYKRSHIVYLSANYHLYTLRELEAQMGMPWRKIMKLAERHGIRKRKPYPKKKGEIQDCRTALA